jgi:hypothetical protein
MILKAEQAAAQTTIPEVATLEAARVLQMTASRSSVVAMTTGRRRLPG